MTLLLLRTRIHVNNGRTFIIASASAKWRFSPVEICGESANIGTYSTIISMRGMENSTLDFHKFFGVYIGGRPVSLIQGLTMAQVS